MSENIEQVNIEQLLKFWIRLQNYYVKLEPVLTCIGKIGKLSKQFELLKASTSLWKPIFIKKNHALLGTNEKINFGFIWHWTMSLNYEFKQKFST